MDATTAPSHHAPTTDHGAMRAAAWRRLWQILLTPPDDPAPEPSPERPPLQPEAES